MLQVIPKWKVEVTVSTGKQHVLWISDNFAENVLRQVASIGFSDDPLVRVVEIRVSGRRESAQDVAAVARGLTSQAEPATRA